MEGRLRMGCKVTRSVGLNRFCLRTQIQPGCPTLDGHAPKNRIPRPIVSIDEQEHELTHLFFIFGSK